MCRSDIHSVVNIVFLIIVEVLVIWCFCSYLHISLILKFLGVLFIFPVIAYIFHRIGPRITGPIIDSLFKNIDM